MKTILFVIVILSLCALAFGPSVTQPPQPPPQKTKPPTEPPPPPPPTEPPVITDPPGTEPPEITEPTGTEPPEVTEPPGTEEPVPTERGKPHPEKQETPKPGGEKPETRVIKLPSSGYGPSVQPMNAGTIARWGLLFLIGLAGIFLAAWSLKR